MEDNPPTSTPVRLHGAIGSFALFWPQYAATAIVFLLYISFYLASHISSDMYDNAHMWPRLEEIEAMTRTSFIAQLLSLPIFAFLFEKLNRKLLACIVSTIFLTTSMGITAATFMCTIYVTEIAHDDIRGSLLVGGEILYRIHRATVVFFEEFIGIIAFSWFAIVPPVVVILCFLFWLPETPIYFLRRGNRDGATSSLLWFRRDNTPESIAQEVDNLEEVLKATQSDAACSRNIFHELFNKRTLQYSGIALVLHVTLLFSGDSSATWVVSVLPERLGKDFRDIVYTLSEVTFVAGTFVAFVLCDKKGRKTLLLFSVVGCSICHIPIAICFHVISSENEFSIEKLFAIIFTIGYTIFNLGLGIGSIIPVVLTDMFPSKLLLIQLVIMGIVTYTVEFLHENYISHHSWELKVLHPALFWTSSAVCAIAALFIFKYLPETMKRPAGFIFMNNQNDTLLRNM